MPSLAIYSIIRSLFGPIARYIPGIPTYKLFEEIKEQARELLNSRKRDSKEFSKTDIVSLLLNEVDELTIIDEGKIYISFNLMN